MSRRLRCSDAGYVYHVLNRAAGRDTLFDKAADYAAFEKVLRQAWERSGLRLLAYVVLTNHWHLVVWPRRDGELSTYVQWLTVTHVRRWHAHHHSGTSLNSGDALSQSKSGRYLKRASNAQRTIAR
jgi:putative transposase